MRSTSLFFVLGAALLAGRLAGAQGESPAGTIAYSRWAGDTIGIHLADPAFTKDRAAPGITTREQIHPALSVDGKKLAFASPGSRDPDEVDLYTINTDGTQQQKILDNATLPAWAPDGKRLLYSIPSQPPAIGVVDADGKNAHPLPVRRRLAVSAFWSPDGSRIGFTGAEKPAPKAADIYLAKADGSGAEKLTDGQKLYLGGSCAWSPDGKQLVLFAADMSTRQGEIQVWDVATKEHHKVIDTGASLQTSNFRLEAKNALPMAAWSPDGKQLLITRATLNQNRLDVALFTILPSGESVKRLTPEGILSFNGSWQR